MWLWEKGSIFGRLAAPADVLEDVNLRPLAVVVVVVAVVVEVDGVVEVGDVIISILGVVVVVVGVDAVDEKVLTPGVDCWLGVMGRNR